MHIEQFYDTGLSHASYAILSNKEVILVDPARDPAPYLAFIRENHAKIIGVIETHPHADFVSSHLEIQKLTGATIYTSALVGADYSHQAFDEGNEIPLGYLTLRAMNTPGHSPDSICVLVLDKSGKQHALFTGDTLFVGDVGRPDLRENTGNMKAKAAKLASAMYHSLHEKIIPLDPKVIIYPAHGPGSLCGKNMRPDLQSTLAIELKENYALQDMSEDEFVKLLISDQPFVPKYFPYDVAVNRAGAEPLMESIARVISLSEEALIEGDVTIVDTRNAQQFQSAHLPHAINIPDGDKFETWLGSIIEPGESFYLIAEGEEKAQLLLKKLAKIGYEGQCKGYYTHAIGNISIAHIPLSAFKKDPSAFTILDIRNDEEIKKGKLFKDAISIPLPRLRESLSLLPQDKPIVVHCAGGYRSAIGSSLVAPSVQVPVYDLSTHVNDFGF